MVDNNKGNQEKLFIARKKACQEAEEKSEQVYDCFLCGENQTVVKRENQYFCFFCEESDFEAECSRCTEIFRKSELTDFGENDYGDTLLFCNACLEYADKD
ncbi:MAG: hypothetical protein Ta2B_10920 [Termitinemataceae bacterium]|nr:MAG: hypothetical protein Ta2B_10920 [Termitinemataceae bacterium]